MSWFKKSQPRALGYTVVSDGESHRCQLPDADRFSRDAEIKCDACNRGAIVVYNGFVGNYWVGEMSDNG